MARSPSLEDGDLTLRDSQAILVYLARKYGGERWLPTEPAPMAQVVSWLMVAENEIARGPNDARLHDKFGDDLDVDLARRKAERILGLMEAYLKTRRWLVLDGPTIADIACMPYVALSHEGGVSLDTDAAYPRLDIADQGTPGLHLHAGAMTMPSTDIAFSPAVKSVQERRGSRGACARLEQNGGWDTKIDAVLKFIAGMRSFYLATASKDRQPYEQHLLRRTARRPARDHGDKEPFPR